MQPTLAFLLNAPGSDDVWVENLLRWVLEVPARGAPSPRGQRLESLNGALLADPRGPQWRARIRNVWSHTSAVRLLADTGLPAHAAFLREGLHRVVERFVPRLDPEADLSGLLHRLDLTERDADWIETLEAGLAAPWRELLALPPEALWDAAQLLAFRAAALGLARDLLGLGPEERELDSPFGRLPDVVGALRRGEVAEWPALLAACLARLQVALAYLERHGVSTELVYRLDLLEAHLRRLEELAALADGRLDGQAFAAALVRQAARHRSLGSLLRSSTQRLARKVVEHAGQTGEHYIANTRAEWVSTFWAAAWGGVLTAVTAALKYGIAAAALAPMIAGLAFAGNYAGSFVVMQFAGFTLASKMPAMTAARLAGALEERRPGDSLEGLVAGIARSQVVAVLGNVLWTVPASLALALGWELFTGGPMVSAATARHTLEGMHPFASWTIPYAAGTGVFLWASSLAGGWAANWSRFRRLPGALARHRRLGYWLGPERAAALGRLVERHLGGVCGYVALGFLLGFTPVLCQFMGIPLEVRHVTLAAASVAIGAGHYLTSADPLPVTDLAWALAGVGAVAVFNLGISFLLALRTAIDARGLDRPGREGLHRQLWRAFLAHPWRFLGPPPAL